MKKSLLFLLLSSFAFGQDLNHFKNIDSLQFEKSISEIIALTGRNYKADDFGEYKGKRYFKFINSENKDDSFTITGYRAFKDANPALEVKGKETWGITSISGPFLAVYPFWLKFIDNGADRDKIIKEENASTLKDRFTRMYKDSNSGNYWILEF